MRLLFIFFVEHDTEGFQMVVGYYFLYSRSIASARGVKRLVASFLRLSLMGNQFSGK